jgi:hypothetical protein
MSHQNREWILPEGYCPLQQVWLSPVQQARIMAAYGMVVHSSGQIECVSTQLCLALSHTDNPAARERETAIGNFEKRLSFLSSCLESWQLAPQNAYRFRRLVKISGLYHRRYRNQFAHGYIERIAPTSSAVGVELLRYRKADESSYILHRKMYSLHDLERIASYGFRIGRAWILARQYAVRVLNIDVGNF